MQISDHCGILRKESPSSLANTSFNYYGMHFAIEQAILT